MTKDELPANELDNIAKCVSHFKGSQEKFAQLAKNLHDHLIADPVLSKLVHSAKFRPKDAEHLHDKLCRKAIQRIEWNDPKAPVPEQIVPDNLFRLVEDLAGVRLLHLHTEEIEQIHPAILAVLDEHRYKVIAPAFASAWDEEYREYYESLHIPAQIRGSMYTSVHYVIEGNSKYQFRCELQVRTLMEEVWGEVSHTMNYPNATPSVACSRQLKVLARVISSGIRLVDSIFASQKEYAAFHAPQTPQPSLVAGPVSIPPTLPEDVVPENERIPLPVVAATPKK